MRHRNHSHMVRRPGRGRQDGGRTRPDLAASRRAHRRARSSEKNVLDFGCNQGACCGILCDQAVPQGARHRHCRAIHRKGETLKGNIPVQHAVGGERSNRPGSTSSTWRSAMRSFTSSRTSTHIAADIFKALKPVECTMPYRLPHGQTRSGRNWRELVSRRTNTVVPGSLHVPIYCRAFAKAGFEVSGGSWSMTDTFHSSRWLDSGFCRCPELLY